MAARKTTPADAILGARIREARVAAGLSGSQLGTAIGVTYQQVQKYEAGKNRIAAIALAAVAATVGLPVAWFFEEPAPKIVLSLSDRVRKLAIEHLGIEPERAVGEAYLVRDLGADSLDLVELQLAIEDDFGIEFGDDDLTKTFTLGDVERLVQRKAALAEASA